MDSPPSAEDDHPQYRVTLEDLASTARACGLPDNVIARCSTLFLMNFWEASTIFGWNHTLIAVEVLAEEGLHQGLRGLKKRDWFRGPELRGLWKRHFYDGSFVAENVRVALDSPAMAADLWAMLDPRRQLLGETDAAYARRFAKEIAALAIHHGYGERKRRRRLSGEWIVYAKHPTGNHYLCLATHKEGDGAIRDRIVRDVVPQFPWVGELLTVERNCELRSDHQGQTEMRCPNDTRCSCAQNWTMCNFTDARFHPMICPRVQVGEPERWIAGA